MEQKVCVNFEVVLNDRTYVFSVPNGAPVVDAFDVAKQLLMTFSNLNEQNKQQEETIPVTPDGE